MSEHLQPPTEPTIAGLIEVLGSLAEKHRVNHPDALPQEDSEVVKAHMLMRQLQVIEQWQRAGDEEKIIELQVTLSTLYIDAGFTDPDYVDEVANDWLIQDLDRAEAAGYDELAANIKRKIFELYGMQPENWQSETAKIALALRDTLSEIECAEVALMDDESEALGYADTLLLE